MSGDLRRPWFPGSLTDPFGLELFDWFKAIEDPWRTPEVDGEGGLRDLALAYSVLESSVTRRQVSVHEVASGNLNECQSRIDDLRGI